MAASKPDEAPSVGSSNLIISPTFNGMRALKQQGPTKRPDRQADIAAYLAHPDLNDLRDHAAKHSRSTTGSLLDRAEWASTSQTCEVRSPKSAGSSSARVPQRRGDRPSG